MYAHTKENDAMTDELVLSQDNETSSSFNTPISTAGCHIDHFYTASWLEANPILKV